MCVCVCVNVCVCVCVCIFCIVTLEPLYTLCVSFVIYIYILFFITDSIFHLDEHYLLYIYIYILFFITDSIFHLDEHYVYACSAL